MKLTETSRNTRCTANKEEMAVGTEHRSVYAKPSQYAGTTDYIYIYIYRFETQ